MISLERLSKKEKIGLGVAAVFVAIVFLDRLLVTSIGDRIRRVNQEIINAEKQLSGDLRHLSQKDQILKEYGNYGQYEEKAGSDDEGMAKVLTEIERVARSSSLFLIDMKPQASKSVGAGKQYTVEIQAEGDQESVVSFLHQLNSSSMLLRGQKVRLSPKEKNSPVLKALITVSKLMIS